MDIKGHDLALLASLSAMLDEKNVTRAAARLGISQPALSAQLARLRDIFGDPLLTPAASGRGMVLTPRAEHLREPLRHALSALAEVVSQPPSFDPRISDRVFNVAANDNASAIVVPRLIGLALGGERKAMRLSFRSVDAARLPDQLESGGLDIALVSGNALPAGFRDQPLLDEEFRMAQRKGHPRGMAAPSLQDYAGLEHVIVSGEGGGFQGFVDTILSKHGCSRRVGVSVQYYSLVPLILDATDLVCTLPARFLQRYSDTLDSLPLPFEARSFSLYATWHPRFDKDPGHLWLRQLIGLCATA